MAVIAKYTLDNTLADSSGNGHHMTGTAGYSDFLDRKVLDGSNGTPQLPNDVLNVLDTNESQLYASFWLYKSSLGGITFLWNVSGSFEEGAGVQITTSSLELWKLYSGITINPHGIPFDQWVFITIELYSFNDEGGGGD